MAYEQIIYLRPEEELTSVRERLERVQSKHIILVIPTQTQLRSHVSWRLLRSRARELKKDILIISSDRRIRSIVKAAGFRVADSLESQPSSKNRTSSRLNTPPLGRSMPRQLGQPGQQISDQDNVNDRVPDIADYPTEILDIQAPNAIGQSNTSKGRANSNDRIGQQLGSYKLIKNLGTSAYLGINTLGGKQVVIKFLFAGLNNFFNNDFRQKALQFTAFKHPNVLQIFECGIDFETNAGYLVMQSAPNSSLREHYPERTTIPLSTVLLFIKQIAFAIQFIIDNAFIAHHKLLEHFIISPENIFLGGNNEILLGGFDNALQRSLFQEWNITYLQSIDEILRTTAGGPLFANLQYQLALTTYEWLCGDLPFQSKSDPVDIAIQHMRVTPPSLHEKNPSIPHEVETVVMKALSKDPEKRYETIQDFADALEEAITSDTDKTDKYKMPDRSGEQFGQYRLVRLLGQGGFAEVYLGQHIKLETFAAIKVLHTRLTAKELEAFEKEAKVIASLKHPSIVRVFDYNAERNVPFLVMDHAPEGTMRQFHARGSRLSLPLVVKYIKQIADALQYAHNQKIIHRDVKPANMLIMSRDTVMLSDFGLAVIAHSERSWRVQDKAGTALYMAPEQFRGKAVPASDQYSLAVTAYEWLCGAPPFEEGDEIQLGYQHAHEPVPAMKDRGAVVSEEVEQVIMRALEKEPTNRFGSVREFAEALEKAAQAG